MFDKVRLSEESFDVNQMEMEKEFLETVSPEKRESFQTTSSPLRHLQMVGSQTYSNILGKTA